MKTGRWTLILLSLVVVLMVLPFLVARGGDFAGADGKALEVITAVDPGYQPWFTPLWEANSETATMLFSLQAALGAGAVAFAFGYWAGRRKRSEQAAHHSGDESIQADARLGATNGG
ncbi:MAG: energy-coupling factor ABC transporter substrate-binding protein [Thermoleophilia bacterium]